MSAKARLPQQSRTIKLKHEEDLQEIFEFDIYYDEAKNRHVCRFFSQFSNKGGDTEQMVVEFPLSKLVQHEVSQMHKLITERLKRRDNVDKIIADQAKKNEMIRLKNILKEHDTNPNVKCRCETCEPARKKLGRLFFGYKQPKSSRPPQ